MNYAYKDLHSDRFLAEYRHLLLNLKTTAEALFLSQVCNVWNVYGGLNRLHNAVESIFKHGTRVYKPDGTPDAWLFIEGLNWINPSLASTGSEISTTIPYARIKNDKALSWLYINLENHTLSQKLSWLISDKEHLASCFEKTAYLCQEKYSEATLICLRAVEQNQPSIITDIDPYLFLNRASVKQLHKSHRRCSSYPEFVDYSRSEIKKEPIVEDLEPNVIESKRDKYVKYEVGFFSSSDNKRDKRNKRNSSTDLLDFKKYNITLVRCDNIKIHTHNNICETDICQIDETPAEPDTNLVSSASEPTFILNTSKECDDSLLSSSNQSDSNIRYGFEPQASSSTRKFSFFHSTNLSKTTSKLSLLSNSAPGFLFTPKSGEVIRNRTKVKTFIEDGGSSIAPMASGFFPKPQPGESLLSFLKSSKSIRTNAELDRENAHFSFSEAMIAAVEQLKYNRIQKNNEEVLESDEEINHLKQRIRLRRRQRMQEKAKIWNASLISDAKTDTTTESVSPASTSDTCDSDVSDSIDLDFGTCARKLQDFKDISVSLASLYSSTEIPSQNSNTSSDATTIHSKTDENLLSAESVALSLISRFREEQLPKASDLVWLVSEQEAPQSLLPFPASWPVSPSDKDSSLNVSNDSFICSNMNCDKNNCNATPLRGTEDWAPPRAQVIFTPHQAPPRKKLLANQNNRCAGCSMRVAARYGHKFRYCEYLGKLFCTGCHSERLATIPGKVLNKWDFKRYQVSNFSYRLLESMWYDPLFRVDLLAPGLYSKSKALLRCKLMRIKLAAVKDFIVACRFAPELHKQFLNEQSHIYNEPDVWSMNDFIQVKSGDLLVHLTELVKSSETHVSQCDLCNARGFVCEVCNRETIFPWQNNVTRCEACGSCYHFSCWNKIMMKCPKCDRIVKRKAARVQEIT